MPHMTAQVLATGSYYPFGGDAGDNRDLTIRLVELIRQALCERSDGLLLQAGQLPEDEWVKFGVLSPDPSRLAEIELHLYWPDPPDADYSRISDPKWPALCLQVICLAIQTSPARRILVDYELTLKLVLHFDSTEVCYLVLSKGECLEFALDHAKSAW